MGYSIGVIAEGALEGAAVETGAAATVGAGAAGAASSAGAGSASTGALSASGLGATAGKMAAQFAISYAVGSIFHDKGSIANPDVQTFLGNGYSSVDPIPVVYGRRRIGGSRALIGISSSSGQTNDGLTQIFVWCEGEISALKTIYFDGIAAADESALPIGHYLGFMNLTHHLGADAQLADPMLIGSWGGGVIWTPECTLSGIAYTRMQLGWTPDLFPNGRPTVTVDCDGRKLYDPRTGSTAFSRNPALVLRDYLVNTRYGCRVPQDMIDDEAFAAAANVCDEVVTIPNFRLATLLINAGGSGYIAGDVVVLEGGVPSQRVSIVVDTVNGSGAILTFHIGSAGSYASSLTTVFSQYSASQHVATVDENGFPTAMTAGSGATFQSATYAQDTQTRYLCDGVVNIDQQPMDNVRALLTSCRGFLVFSGGKYKLKIDRAETPVNFVLHEDNIVGGWQFQLGGKRNRFNRVKARYFNEDAGFQPDIAVQESATFRAADGGQVFETTLELPFTTNVYRVQHMCQIELKRSRRSLMVSLVATIDAQRLEIGDVVPVAHRTPGWPTATDPAEGKLFRVIEIELMANDEVRLTLLEYVASVYQLDELEQTPAVSLTSLPDASSIAAPGTPMLTEQLYDTTGSAGVKSRAIFEWGASPSVWVARGGFYEFEYRIASSTSWNRVVVSTTRLEVSDLAPGLYHCRVRALNAAGLHSAYSATANLEVLGLTSPPAAVSGFFVTIHEGRARFHLDLSPDLDVRQGGRLWIRWSPLTIGATWNDGSLIKMGGYPGDSIVCEGPLYAGTYLAKFQDSTGHFSETEASFVVGEVLLTGFTTLASATFHPTFPGTKVGVAVIESGMQLAGVTLWDAMVGTLDDQGQIDSMGGIQLSGSCTFTQKIDLGSVKSVRIVPAMKTFAFGTGDFWDLRTNNIDNWGLIDEAIVEDAEIIPQVRATDDDPASGGATWKPWHNLEVADYSARGFEFRTLHITEDPTHNRRLIEFSIAAKQPA